MSYLEDLGFQVLRQQAEEFMRGLTDEIKSHVSSEMEKITMALEDSVTRIVSAAQTEAQQLADAIGSLAAQVDEATALRVELDALKAQADSAVSRLDEASAALESDDPTV